MIDVEPRTAIVNCGRPTASPTSTFTRGSTGCQLWEREPGIDDDDWDPPGSPRIGRYKPEPRPAPRARSGGVDGWWSEPPQSRRPAAPVHVTPALVPTRDPFGGLFNWNDD